MAISDREWLPGSPFSQYQRVEVMFPSVANTDFLIRHNLSVVDPDSVEYSVLKINTGAGIYHDSSATRKAWGTGYILLRSTAASVKATILLTVPRL